MAKLFILFSAVYASTFSHNEQRFLYNKVAQNQSVI